MNRFFISWNIMWSPKYMFLMNILLYFYHTCFLWIPFMKWFYSFIALVNTTLIESNSRYSTILTGNKTVPISPISWQCSHQAFKNYFFFIKRQQACSKNNISYFQKYRHDCVFKAVRNIVFVTCLVIFYRLFEDYLLIFTYINNGQMEHVHNFFYLGHVHNFIYLLILSGK